MDKDYSTLLLMYIVIVSECPTIYYIDFPSHTQLCACMHSIIVIVNHVYAWSWYSLYMLTCSTCLCFTYSQASHDNATVFQFIAIYSYTIGVDAWCMRPHMCSTHTLPATPPFPNIHVCGFTHCMSCMHAWWCICRPGAPIETIQCSAELHDYALTETLDPVYCLYQCRHRFQSIQN